MFCLSFVYVLFLFVFLWFDLVWFFLWLIWVFCHRPIVKCFDMCPFVIEMFLEQLSSTDGQKMLCASRKQKMYLYKDAIHYFFIYWYISNHYSQFEKLNIAMILEIITLIFNIYLPDINENKNYLIKYERLVLHFVFHQCLLSPTIVQ